MSVCVCISLYTFVDDNDDYNDYYGFIEHKIDESSVIMWDVCIRTYLYRIE